MPTSPSKSSPPLSSLKVLELAGLAPAPYCGLLLAQYGASVLRVDRPSPPPPSSNSSSKSGPNLAGPAPDLLTSHKSSLPLNLKSASSRSFLLKLVSVSDVLIDPFRPGVLEKLGLDPVKVLLELNPRLIIVRLTGFRKDGEYKDMAGHDINYLAVSGVLSLLGGSSARPPMPPANLLADFGGGGLVAFAGVLLALISRGVTGRGQVVDANMVDGVSSLATFPRLLLNGPSWNKGRGKNLLDGGAPFYGCYECLDQGTYVAVGALEEKFFQELLRGLGLTEAEIVPEAGMSRSDRRSWEFMRGVLERTFKAKKREEWERIFGGTDACVTPVLTFGELKGSGHRFRPMVGLENSPGRDVGAHYETKGLQVGEGGDIVVGDWLGWQKGKQWDIDQDGAAVLNEKGSSRGSKL